MSTHSLAEAAERRQERRHLEATLFSLEADRTHVTRRRDDQVMLLQGARQKLRQAEREVAEAETILDELEAKITEKDIEIAREKKKLQLL